MATTKYNPNTGKFEPVSFEDGDNPNDLLKPNSRVGTAIADHEGLGRNPNFSGSSDYPNRNGDFTNGLAQRIINSAPYQMVYAIFSKLDDKSWLQQLELIPYSTKYADAFSGEMFTQSDEERDDAAYQYCIEKIENLYQAYRQYVLDLPSTQRQQLANAGIYDASSITGASVNPSESPIANPSSVHLENPTLDIVGRVGDAIFSASSGALAWFSALKQAEFTGRGLDLQESALGLQKRALDQKDLALLFDKERISLAREQFANSVDAEKSVQALQYFDQAISYLQLGYENVPDAPSYIAETVGDLGGVKNDKASKVPQNLAAMDFSRSSHKLAATPSVTDESLSVMQGYNDYTFELWKLEIKRDAAIAERDRIVSQYESGLAAGASGNGFKEGQYIAELNKRIARYNSRIADHKMAYMEGLYKQGQTNKFARYAYGYMMSGYDFNAQKNNSIMTQYNVDHGWVNTGVSSLGLFKK